MKTKARLWIWLVVCLAIALSGFSISYGKQTSDSTTSKPSYTTEYALVQLVGDPLSTYSKTKPLQGKKIDFNSSQVKSYRALLAERRNEFKSWLRENAPNARVTGEYDLALNAVSVKLNGTSLDTLRKSPLVKAVEYEGLYYPTDANDPDLNIINALQAWAQGGGPANAGKGVKVAIIDSGIDVNHPCFDDSGYPQQRQLGDTRFTNNKVIVAKVFYNKAKVQGLTPEAIDTHGTHVAGTVACNLDTPANVNGVDIPYRVSGVAPRALLGNYNVFPGTVGSARSEDILNALEEAYKDGFDIANMSLGGGYRGVQDLLTQAVDNLDRANMVITVSMGNNGPGYFTGGSPGSAERALTAGASTVPHFVGAPVTVDGKGTFGAAAGDFATVSEDLTAPLAVVTSNDSLDTACTVPQRDLSGHIALISRGVSSFSTKIRNVQQAGAIAALVANNVAGDPTAMGQDGTPNQPTIPAYMISRDAGQELLDADGNSTTISASLSYFLTNSVDIMAGFSSWGPTRVDYRIKPDVVAPGVNVLSSIPGDCGELGCWAFYQGTSMSAPHLAGSAAVIKSQHPDWSSWQIRSAITNTANDDVLKDYRDGTTIVRDSLIRGAGREDLLAAVNAKVALDPVSITFGLVPSGSGQSSSRTVTVANISGTTLTGLSVQITDVTGSGVTYNASISSSTLANGEQGTIRVNMKASKGAPTGFHEATLRIYSNGTEIAHAEILTVIK